MSLSPEPPQQPPEPASPSAPSALGHRLQNPLRRRAFSVSEQIERMLSSLPFLVGGGFLCLALVGWSLGWQLPKASETRVVAAREEIADLSQKLVDAQNVGAVNQASLSNQLASAQTYLIPRRDAIVSLVSEIERVARHQGWRAEVNVKPSAERLSPTEAVNVYPATVRLQALAGTQLPPYQRLINLMEQIEEMPMKVEVVSLVVVSDRGAFLVPQLELQFWTRKTDEKPASK